MHSKFQKSGIVYNSKIKDSYKLALQIKEKISGEIYDVDNISSDINLAIVVGGDGSFLKTARFCALKNIPVMGFNLGRLGYLAQAKPDEADNVFEKLNNGKYILEKRIMLEGTDKIALNDIVIKGENSARTSTLDLYINEKLLCSYIADGLIVSTPTGSTAYSLSAGGPIISPELECILIIPICPHTLTTRPIVVPSTEKIKIQNHEGQKLNISFDGQVDVSINGSIEIKKSSYFASLVILDEQKNRFYDILKEKLHWAIKPEK